MNHGDVYNLQSKRNLRFHRQRDKRQNNTKAVLITYKHRFASCYDAVSPGVSWQSTGWHSEAPVILAGSADKC